MNTFDTAAQNGMIHPHKAQGMAVAELAGQF